MNKKAGLARKPASKASPKKLRERLISACIRSFAHGAKIFNSQFMRCFDMEEHSENIQVDYSDQEDLCLALYELYAVNGGIKQCAFDLGRSPDLLYKWANANCEHYPPLLSLIALEMNGCRNRGKEPVWTKAYLKKLGYSISRLNGDDIPHDEVRACIHAVATSGEFIAAVAQALADQKITKKEAKTLLPTIDAHISELRQLRGCLADVAGGA